MTVVFAYAKFHYNMLTGSLKVHKKDLTPLGVYLLKMIELLRSAAEAALTELQFNCYCCFYTAPLIAIKFSFMH